MQAAIKRLCKIMKLVPESGVFTKSTVYNVTSNQRQFVRCQSSAAGSTANTGAASSKSTYHEMTSNYGHMDQLPQPCGSWQDGYNKQNKVYNILLIVGILVFSTTLATMIYTGIIYSPGMPVITNTKDEEEIDEGDDETPETPEGEPLPLPEGNGGSYY